MTFKPGDYILRPLNGDLEYKFESENGEEIKNYWSIMDKKDKISCINSAIKDRTKNLVDVIITEMKENAS